MKNRKLALWWYKNASSSKALALERIHCFWPVFRFPSFKHHWTEGFDQRQSSPAKWVRIRDEDRDPPILPCLEGKKWRVLGGERHFLPAKFPLYSSPNTCFSTNPIISHHLSVRTDSDQTQHQHLPILILFRANWPLQIQFIPIQFSILLSPGSQNLLEFLF